MAFPDFDLCVIGGGINGVALARDAAGRGWRVILVEAGDLAAGTSSASTGLIHGGLRYLEYGDFPLIYEALRERAILLKTAPHLVRPLRFVLPFRDGVGYPCWMLRAGLSLYDGLSLGQGGLPRHRPIDRVRNATDFDVVREDCEGGFAYYDASGDDSRLTVLNAVDAADRGAIIRTRTACVDMKAKQNVWYVTLQDTGTAAREQITARAVINATGPRVRSFLDYLGLSDARTPEVRLVKGSHLIVPRLYDGDHAYILRQPDGRVVFVKPFANGLSCIGTTEVTIDPDAIPSVPTASEEEIDYMTQAVARWFRAPVDRILGATAGIRTMTSIPGVGNSALSRRAFLYMDRKCGPPILSIIGGKLTTHRALAEDGINRLSLVLAGVLDNRRDRAPAWTANAPLPGGDLPAGGMDALITHLQQAFAAAPVETIHRLAHAYGSKAESILQDSKTDIVPGLSDGELRWLVTREFARGAEDVLYRRTRLGYTLPADAAAKITAAIPRVTA